MSIKSATLILILSLCSHISAEESSDSIRKGKFLGFTGYLSGSTDGFRVVPFWKQWNALLQVNVEKNKHKHNGVYVLPASPFYYPPYAPYAPYDNYGLHYAGLNYGGLGGGYRPMPLLYDEYKPHTSTLAPLNADPADKPKLDLDEDEDDLNQLPNPSDQKVSVFKLNVRDDRKTHKRDILHKNQTEEEVVATVVELTDVDAIQTTTDASTNEPTTDTTTDLPDPTTTTISATAATTLPPDTPETTTQPISITTPTTTAEIPTSASVIDTGFQPLLNFYYGGTPNENANYIYFTTNEPTHDLAPSTENPIVAHKRSDHSGDFKPSIQYQYRNYRYDTDSHFVPIVGTQQIF